MKIVLRKFWLLLPLLLTIGIVARAQSPATPVAADRNSAAQEEILQRLDQWADWYRSIDGLRAAPDNARETVVMGQLQHAAGRVLLSGFDYARAKAATLSPVVATADDAADDAPRVDPNKMAAYVVEVNNQLATLQGQLNDVNTRLKDPAADRTTLLAERHRIVTALAFTQAQADLLGQVKGFITGAQPDADKSFIGAIDAMEQGFPELQQAAPTDPTKTTDKPNDKDAATPDAKADNKDDAQAAQARRNPGILAAIGEFFPLWRKRTEIDSYLKSTAALEKHNDERRRDLRLQLQAMIRQGRAAMGLPVTAETTPALPSAAPTTPPPPADLGILAVRLRQITAMIVPLSAQHQAYDDSRTALMQWRALLDRDFKTSLWQLVIRLVMLTIVISIALGLSNLAQRATLKYIKDARRRRQLRTVRRLIVGVVIGIVVFVSLISEVGSFATYAGLLTAGMAVALQNVILSAFCYFFMLGRFGIRVGERVTVGTTTGEVIEVGLLRIYIMEMANNAATGRIAVFPNLVFFQPTAFYKQVAGANYIWHDITLHFAHDVDQGLLRSKLLAGAGAVYADYHADLKKQHAALENATHLRVETPHPDCTIEVLPDGVACTVHYPLELGREAEIDKRMNAALMAAVQGDARLKLAGAAS